MEVTFIEEDGSGKSNATSYVTVDEMKQYWYDIGYDYGGATDNDIKRLLNKSTLYIDSNYDWPGYKQTSTQRLQWPRYGAYTLSGYDIDEDTIPNEVKDAVSEMAHMINNGIDPFANISAEGQIKSISSSVDVIKESITYVEGTTMSSDIYTKIDSILYDLTGGVSNRFILSIVRVGGDSP